MKRKTENPHSNQRKPTKFDLDYFERRCYALLREAPWRFTGLRSTEISTAIESGAAPLLPESKIRKAACENIRAYVTVDNLFDLSKVEKEYERKQKNDEARAKRMEVEIQRAKDRILFKGANIADELEKFQSLINKEQ